MMNNYLFETCQGYFNGMGGARGIWGRNEMHMEVWWVNLKKRDNLQVLGVYASIILKLVMNTVLWEDVEWIHLAEDTEKW
jgi:hypothetical protein